MAAPGQRIHPAGSRPTLRSPSTRRRRRRHEALDAIPRARRLRRRLRRPRVGRALARGRRHGARGRGAGGPPRGGVDRQLGRRRRPADPDPRTASSTATPTASACTSSPACPFGVGRLLPAPRARRPSAQSVAHDRGGARRGRHPLPRLARRAGQSRRPRPDRARLVPGDPAGAGGPPRAGGRRGRVGARALPGATGDGATSGEREPARLLRLLPLLPHHRLQGSAHRHPAPRLLHRLPLSRSTRARSRSSTSATRPTRCRAGRWPSRSGCWPTTARSTRSGATGTR